MKIQSLLQVVVVKICIFYFQEDFEETLHAQIEAALKKKSTKPLVESMSRMLLSEGDRGGSGDSADDPTDVKPNKVNKTGLLMDWLHLLDPELTQASHDVKQKLLFGKGRKLSVTISKRLACERLDTNSYSGPNLNYTQPGF